MPFGTGHWPYLIILLVIVLIIWGPHKLPDLGAGMGKAIREFRKASTEVKDQIVNTTAQEPTPAPPPAQPQPPTPPAAQTPAQPPAAVPPVGHPTEHPSA
jgi:sec-independent protein translocase protein TatA